MTNASRNAVTVLPTRYAGVLFRSRLEARWAVFFDSLGIRWEYEPEGFDLGGGVRYLPDFWLPGFCVSGLFVEVKPDNGALTDFSKARLFAKLSGNQILLARGAPGKTYYVVQSNEHANGIWACFKDKYLPGGVNESEYRLFYESYPFDFDPVDGWINGDGWVTLGVGVSGAIESARATRFA